MKISFLLMLSYSQAMKAAVWCHLLLEENITLMMSQWCHQHLRLSLETKNVQQKSLPNCICGVWKMFMLQAGRVWWKKLLSCILGNGSLMPGYEADHSPKIFPCKLDTCVFVSLSTMSADSLYRSCGCMTKQQGLRRCHGRLDKKDPFLTEQTFYSKWKHSR